MSHHPSEHTHTRTHTHATGRRMETRTHRWMMSSGHRRVMVFVMKPQPVICPSPRSLSCFLFTVRSGDFSASPPPPPPPPPPSHCKIYIHPSMSCSCVADAAIWWQMCRTGCSGYVTAAGAGHMMLGGVKLINRAPDYKGKSENVHGVCVVIVGVT